jgi:hypothetical protein
MSEMFPGFSSLKYREERQDEEVASLLSTCIFGVRRLPIGNGGE